MFTGWRIDRNGWDWMHILYVTGVANDFCASLLAFLVDRAAWGIWPLRDQSLGFCRDEFRQWFPEHGMKRPSIPRFSTKTIGLSKSWKHMPVLSGQLKAALIKPLLLFLTHVCARVVRGAADDEGKLIHSAAFSLSNMVHICDNEPLIMMQTKADEAAAAGHGFLRLHGVLSKGSWNVKPERWNIRPKHHYLQESLLFMQASCENAAKQTCMMEEDFMGKIKKIALKTHRSTTYQRAMQRYLILLKTRWQAKVRDA
jgi:hypothetical protein